LGAPWSEGEGSPSFLSLPPKQKEGELEMDMKLEDLQQIDIVNVAIRDAGQGIAEAKEGKIRYKFDQLMLDSPWIFGRECGERECKRWHKIYFEKFGILPRGCMHCWKIVVRPKNLDELFELEKLQQKMKDWIPCKCGVDLRQTETYKGIHLGFFYCPLGDLPKAKELYKEVRNKVRGALALDTPVILKRGCTEMENHFGPSHLWTYPLQMRAMEGLLDTCIDVVAPLMEQTEMLKNHIRAFWIIYSHRNRDKTARKYIRNFPSTTGSIPTTTYHDVLPEIKEEVVPYEIGIQRV
jgi:hypothetical protein